MGSDAKPQKRLVDLLAELTLLRAEVYIGGRYPNARMFIGAEITDPVSRQKIGVSRDVPLTELRRMRDPSVWFEQEVAPAFDELLERSGRRRS